MKKRNVLMGLMTAGLILVPIGGLMAEDDTFTEDTTLIAAEEAAAEEASLIMTEDTTVQEENLCTGDGAGTMTRSRAGNGTGEGAREGAGNGDQLRKQLKDGTGENCVGTCLTE